ncbi:MAG: hypothetical protein KF779_16110 [Hyphomonadaceae bacterium]|nr:hypothetical protein [Hyphomonadaceae bacterium]
MPDRAYLLDSNVFLQCRRITDLPWHEFAPDGDLTLMPAPSAIDEIDRLKGDGNARRARRAREANAILREMLVSDEGDKTWTSGTRRIRLAFPPIFQPEDDRRISAIQRPDQRIVEEALIIRQTVPQIEVLSHDTGLCWRAMRAGLQFQLVPDDWLLSETDAHQAEIDDLRRQLSVAKANDPILHVGVRGLGERGALTLRTLSYEPIPHDAVVRLIELAADSERMARFRERLDQASAKLEAMLENQKLEGHIARDRELQNLRKKLERTDEGVAKTNAKRAMEAMTTWRSSIETKLAKTSAETNSIARLNPLTIVISNKGARPGLETRVSVRGVGPVRVANQMRAEVTLGDLASRPASDRPLLAGQTFPAFDARSSAVTRKRLDTTAQRSRYWAMRTAEPKDKFAWYVAEDVDPQGAADAARITLACAELRHDGAEAELEVVVSAVDDERTAGAVIVEVTASNAPTARLTIPIELVRENRGSDVIVDAVEGAIAASVGELDKYEASQPK